jgi:hypothetical protein
VGGGADRRENKRRPNLEVVIKNLKEKQLGDRMVLRGVTHPRSPLLTVGQTIATLLSSPYLLHWKGEGGEGGFYWGILPPGNRGRPEPFRGSRDKAIKETDTDHR